MHIFSEIYAKGWFFTPEPYLGYSAIYLLGGICKKTRNGKFAKERFSQKILIRGTNPFRSIPQGGSFNTSRYSYVHIYSSPYLTIAKYKQVLQGAKEITLPTPKRLLPLFHKSLYRHTPYETTIYLPVTVKL